MSLLKFLTSKLFFKQLIIAAIGVVVFIFILLKWLDITTHHDQKIEVPDLSKMHLDKVEETLDEIDLNFIVIDSASFNPDYPKKSVIEHSPEAGEFVKENRKIYLTLNPSGYRNVAIPEFYGKTRRNITPILRSIGFRVDEEVSYVSDIAKDVVRGMKYKGRSLKVGNELPKNSVITLVLGNGEGKRPYKETTDKD